MIHHRRFSLLLVILTVFGCGSLSVSPEWGCIQTEGTIDLFEKLDRSSKPPQLVNTIGKLDAGTVVRVVDSNKGPSGGSTHFQVQTRDGVNGWFAWEGNKFTGWHSTSCW